MRSLRIVGSRNAALLILVCLSPLAACSNLPKLHSAIERGKTEKALEMIQANEGIDERDEFGQLPLHRAAQKGLIPVAEALLAKDKSKLKDRSKNGSTPLLLACIGGKVDMCKYLIAKGASPRSANNLGGSCLHQAAYHGWTEVIDVLMDKGASAGCRTKRSARPPGLTPMHFAAMRGKLEAVKCLHKRRTSLDPGGGKGIRPLNLAIQNGHKKVSEYLLTNGVRPRIAPGQTSLNGATFMAAAECLEKKDPRAAARYYTTAAKEFETASLGPRRRADAYSKKATNEFAKSMGRAVLVGLLNGLARSSGHGGLMTHTYIYNTTPSKWPRYSSMASSAGSLARKYEKAAKHCRERAKKLTSRK
jgi:Ankyrin repeats (3 copies)